MKSEIHSPGDFLLVLLYQLSRCHVKAMKILDIQILCLGCISSSLEIVKFVTKGVDLHGLMLTVTKIK